MCFISCLSPCIHEVIDLLEIIGANGPPTRITITNWTEIRTSQLKVNLYVFLIIIIIYVYFHLFNVYFHYVTQRKKTMISN